MGARKLKIRDQNLIVTDPDILMGKPTVKGTRLSVELILEKMSSGETIENLLEAHPRLTKDAVYAALDYAARVLKTDIVEPLPLGNKRAVRG